MLRNGVLEVLVPVLPTDCVQPIAAIDVLRVEIRHLKRMTKPVRQIDVGIDVHQPAVMPEIGKAEVDRASLVKTVAIVMKNGCFYAVSREFIAKPMG
jgi:hypothetical protein